MRYRTSYHRGRNTFFISKVNMMQFSNPVICKDKVSIVMAVLRIFKRNSTFMDMADLVNQISSLGLNEALQNYYNKQVEKEAKGRKVYQLV